MSERTKEDIIGEVVAGVRKDKRELLVKDIARIPSNIRTFILIWLVGLLWDEHVKKGSSSEEASQKVNELVGAVIEDCTAQHSQYCRRPECDFPANHDGSCSPRQGTR